MPECSTKARSTWRGAVALACATSLTLALCSSTGCSSNGNATPGAPDGATDGAVTHDAADDAGEGGDPDQACNDIAFLGPAVETVYAPGDPPAPTGGMIVAGTYVLTKATIYNADGSVGPTGMTIRKTAELGASTYEFIESEGTVDGGVSEEEHTSRSFVSAGSALVQTNVCPAAGTQMSSYSVVGDELHLYAPNEFTVQVLTRR